jgi:hypothetical protein
MSTCVQTKIADLVVATEKIQDGQFIAYRVDENGVIDANHIGFGHGETRDAAIIDLYRRTK